MAKSSRYVCQQCGYESVGWLGKCPSCDSWGSLVETLVSTVHSAKGKEQRKEAKKPISLNSVPKISASRISTMIPELDRVLGAGLVSGQVTLIAGEPGIGKSTLLLQVADNLSNSKSDALYISGEESAHQIKVRADRLGIKNKSIRLMEETDVGAVIQEVSQVKKTKTSDTSCVIVDSIQTMTTSDLSGMAGSVGQVRESASRLVRVAKSKNLPVFIVGHVTKEGTVAGPATLMHIVDTVLWFEGDKSSTTRILRAVKNRFGPTDEVGVFEMQDMGLISIDDPEKIFLTNKKTYVAGSCVASILQGTRPILVEIQSLVNPSKMAYPKRVSQGIDISRFELLLAVLTRRCGLPLYEYDCFVNVAGGISLRSDPSADLAITLSIASAFFDKAMPQASLAVGEVGLLGDIREVVAQEKRIKEARRLGYKLIISNRSSIYLQEAIKKFLRTQI